MIHFVPIHVVNAFLNLSNSLYQALLSTTLISVSMILVVHSYSQLSGTDICEYLMLVVLSLLFEQPKNKFGGFSKGVWYRRRSGDFDCHQYKMFGNALIVTKRF